MHLLLVIVLDFGLLELLNSFAWVWLLALFATICLLFTSLGFLWVGLFWVLVGLVGLLKMDWWVVIAWFTSLVFGRWCCLFVIDVLEICWFVVYCLCYIFHGLDFVGFLFDICFTELCVRLCFELVLVLLVMFVVETLYVYVVFFICCLGWVWG